MLVWEFFFWYTESAERQEGKAMKEIILGVEEAPEGGYTARALGASIFTEADTLVELRGKIRDATNCHFEGEHQPKIIRLHFVKEEMMVV
jgi:hypothetical protein